MVHTCAAVGCHNRKNPGTSESFYRFPREEPRRGKWIAAVRRVDWQPTDSSRLCSAHFISGKKSEDPVSPDYVPSIFDYVPSHVKRKRHCDLDTYEHRQKLKTRRKEQQKETERRYSSGAGEILTGRSAESTPQPSDPDKTERRCRGGAGEILTGNSAESTPQPSDPDKTERRCRGGAGEILTGNSAESTPQPSDPDKTERRCRGGAGEILTGNSAESTPQPSDPDKTERRCRGGAGENLTQNPVDYEAEYDRTNKM
ncbi:peroxynitrite isomerase THAP4-like [Branchiostoma floridae]|uniref:Peroxynitrite isomerase THAP4-like n=1 Tax=Branchiostoma floridae TaxID=7739 RepID=A0A9J7MLN8_BRAFL|nr:peroxynitrite isomerase THAP4-like [Branchiostoma floridae]